MTAVKYVSSVVLAAVIFVTAAVNCGSNENSALESYSFSESTGALAEDFSDNFSQIADDETAGSLPDFPTFDERESEKVTDTSVTSSSTTTATATTASDSSFSTSNYINEILSLVNAERTNAGVSKLKVNSRLTSAAQTRAEELAQVNTLKPNNKHHVRPNGSSWCTLFGISEDENYNYGENLISGFLTPAEFVRLWMGSSGHKQNILNKDYIETGVGCARAEDDMVYCVQFFYKP